MARGSDSTGRAAARETRGFFAGPALASRGAMVDHRPRRSVGKRALVAFLAALFPACAQIEEKRIRQLLHEKGFGTQAQGDATQENYVAGGDLVQFLVDPTLVLQPGMEQLALLRVAQPVAIDGTILIPYVGPVKVLGMSETELGVFVTEELQRFFQPELIRIQARIAGLGKGLYFFGEVIFRGRQPFAKPDLTLFEALAYSGTTSLANLGRVRVVRPDAQNPLVIEVNYREMVLTGLMVYNIRLRENDIIYVPPTFFGALARFIEKLLQPIAVTVQALFGVAHLRQTYDILRGDNVFYGRYFF
jgi:protein involved in polysaccharide export with SLBB domain